MSLLDHPHELHPADRMADPASSPSRPPTSDPIPDPSAEPTADPIARPVPEPCSLELRDGRSVTCRRARPGDGAALVALYEGLSAQSRYTRFCQATPRLTSGLQRALVDLGSGPVWLAHHAGRCVGEARLVRARDGSLHLAMAVADGFQGSGLGHELGRCLLADPDARRSDIVVTILAGNTPAARLARRAGFQLHLDDGLLEGRLPART